MLDEDRVSTVKSLLSDHLKSPSLRHIRDQQAISRLARTIVEKLDRGDTVWRKWDPSRENLVRATTNLWVPLEDLVAFLNQLPGAVLTSTDVSQRLRMFQEEPPYSFPDERLRDECLARYAEEKRLGTEMPAIIGALQEFVAAGERRLRDEQGAAYRKKAEEQAEALQKRFLAGMDSKWTSVEDRPGFYSRVNGRTYWVMRAKDKIWQLMRIEAHTDEKGLILGRYKNRADATRVVAIAAYQPEPRR